MEPYTFKLIFTIFEQMCFRYFESSLFLVCYALYDEMLWNYA